MKTQLVFDEPGDTPGAAIEVPLVLEELRAFGNAKGKLGEVAHHTYQHDARLLLRFIGQLLQRIGVREHVVRDMTGDIGGTTSFDRIRATAYQLADEAEAFGDFTGGNILRDAADGLGDLANERAEQSDERALVAESAARYDALRRSIDSGAAPWGINNGADLDAYCDTYRKAPPEAFVKPLPDVGGPVHEVP
jgi:hypothetical protein